MENMMARASDKKKWDELHTALAKANGAKDAYELELARKYGSIFQRSWLTRTQQAKQDALRDRANKIGDKIIDLLVEISPRGDAWLSGVPAWWLREKLTWEDAIRPANETLSVIVPGAYGYRDGHVQEHRMESMMPKKQDASEFKELLDKGVILVAGDGDVIDLDDDEPVRVGIIFDVNGFGPHVGSIYAMQRGHVDEALQAAEELLEEWTLDHYPDQANNEYMTETFEGRTWTLSPEDFADAIEGTTATKFIEMHEEEEETEEGVLEEGCVSEPNDARDILEGLGPYLKHEGHDAPRESARIARMIASAGRSGKKAEAVLEEVDKLINGHGVEAIRDENAYDSYYGDVIAEYVNTGDTYAATLLYDVREHEFHVTSWGDWYEAYEAEQEEEPEEDDEEPEDDDDDVFSREEMDEGYVISDKRGGGYSVSDLGSFDDMDEALEAIEKDMKKSNVYPNIYYVNDHGNIDLLDSAGNTIKSRV